MDGSTKPPHPRRILPAREALGRVGMSRTQAWTEERAGRFPRRIQITPYRIGWYEDEIDAFVASRPRAGAAISMPKSPGRLGKRNATVEAA